MRIRIVGLMGLLCLWSCGKTPPQRPTVLGEERSDTTAVQLLTMNQQMANEADLQLSRMAEEGYVLMDENYWVKGLKSDEGGLMESEYVEMDARFYTLKGQLLTTHQAQAQIGRVDEIKAIVAVLAKMQRGDSVSMLVPWYMAFGSAGNREVPPYENIRVELKIE